ncbi:MAG TPA: hypothetical protein VG388_06870 [Solirubrobacteraceae bacterium]|jgi:hypothetical protein|nr:hypothetical protein [Solirubrobacteraceae bacterium]
MVMPPGHHREIATRRPLAGREKWVLWIVGAGLAVFAVVLVVALTAPTQTTARGCVDVSIVGPTGAAAIHQCGAGARQLCHSTRRATGDGAETAREIRAACRRSGFAVG